MTTARLTARAEPAGEYRQSTRGLTLQAVGFVHAATANQITTVARRFYADEPDPLVLLVVDIPTCEAAGSPVVWEAVLGAGVFPHVYGPLPWSAIVAVLPVGMEGDRLDVPDLTPYDVVVEPPTRAVS